MLPGEGWTDKLASPPWVEDLIREGIIGGPHPIRKIEGRGLGQRFAPRDYRDLLRTISLKSQGEGRRSAWVAHLWLAGRDYPISRVRDAFHAEIQKLTRGALKDLAPRERLNTQPFGERFDRRIRQRKEDTLYPELVDIIEPMAAWGIARRYLPQIGTNPSAIAKMISEITGSPAEPLSAAIAEMVSSLKEGRSLSLQAQREIQTFLQATIRDHGLEALLQSQEYADAVSEASANLEGSLGTFSVKEQSTLLCSIDAATERQWEITRAMFRDICSGQIERGFAMAAAEASPKYREPLKLASLASGQHRQLARGTPWVRLYLFVHCLHDLVKRKKHPDSEDGSPQNPRK
jgi:hypothetical protein